MKDRLWELDVQSYYLTSICRWSLESLDESRQSSVGSPKLEGRGESSERSGVLCPGCRSWRE